MIGAQTRAILLLMSPMTKPTPLPVNSTIGILGGGQLARMMGSAAAKLGFRTVFLEPGKDAPAVQTCNAQIIAEYDDETALHELARQCDVITYEFENVPASAAQFITANNTLYPPARALEVSQDRLLEKTFLQEHNIEVAPFKNIETAHDLADALETLEGGVLKTRRFGYDGKGQRVFQNSKCDDPEGVISEMGGGPFVLEKLIGFKSEFSIIAARNIAGEIIAFDPATNIHENGILRQSTVPASLDQDTASRAKQVAKTVLEALDYVGVIGIEFFETDDGLLVNEFAPRVHNSGHWTEETCAISQFEQHIRAITGLPLGSVERHHDCKMGNLLGDEAENISQLLQNPNTSVTLYGKLQSREGRKMGHFTELFDLSK